MQNELIALLEGRSGHFEMESGYHSERWFNLDVLFENQPRLQPFVSELAHRLDVHGIDAVCGPMTGGAKLAQMIATTLGVECYQTERLDPPPSAKGLFPVKYVVPIAQRKQVTGKLVVIIDDAISAGSAVKGTYADLIECGARPVACGALFLFGMAAANFCSEKNLQLESLVHLDFNLWPPADCPLCKAGLKAEKISDKPRKN